MILLQKLKGAAGLDKRERKRALMASLGLSLFSRFLIVSNEGIVRRRWRNKLTSKFSASERSLVCSRIRENAGIRVVILVTSANKQGNIRTKVMQQLLRVVNVQVGNTGFFIKNSEKRERERDFHETDVIA